MWTRAFLAVLVLVALIAILDILSPGDQDGEIPMAPRDNKEDLFTRLSQD